MIAAAASASPMLPVPPRKATAMVADAAIGLVASPFALSFGA